MPTNLEARRLLPSQFGEASDTPAVTTVMAAYCGGLLGLCRGDGHLGADLDCIRRPCGRIASKGLPTLGLSGYNHMIDFPIDGMQVFGVPASGGKFAPGNGHSAAGESSVRLRRCAARSPANRSRALPSRRAAAGRVLGRSQGSLGMRLATAGRGGSAWEAMRDGSRARSAGQADPPRLVPGDEGGTPLGHNLHDGPGMASFSGQTRQRRGPNE